MAGQGPKAGLDDESIEALFVTTFRANGAGKTTLLSGVCFWRIRRDLS